MKLAIIGGRNFNDFAALDSAIKQYFCDQNAKTIDGYTPQFTQIVSGGAVGADSLGAKWGRERGVKVVEFLPDWERYGKRAGFLRNQTIIDNATHVLAFWDGVSKGTGNSLSLAKKQKKTTVIVYF